VLTSLSGGSVPGSNFYTTFTRRRVSDSRTKPTPSRTELLGSGTVLAKKDPDVLRTARVGLAAASAAVQTASVPQKNCTICRGV